MKYWILAVLMGVTWLAMAQNYFNKNTTLTYDELIETYQEIDANHINATLLEMGPTDAGRNLHLLLVSGTEISPDQSLAEIAKGKTVLFINNGIHPGESCGIDASILFVYEILKKKLPKDVLVAIVPVYNVGGMLNRNSYSRANQNGPAEHGFRGNARNLDLNRDFIKADALNTFSFYAIFQALQPHIFVDTHTSNGADYQYTMTLISTQKDKLNPVLAKMLTEEIEPSLYKNMEKEGYPMTPYVNVFGYTPDKGFAAFLESPRYASGYTTLFNTIGFITEAHMLKPYNERVEATRSFLHVIHSYVSKNSEELRAAREAAFEYDKNEKQFAINWELDSAQVKTRDFAGYDYKYEDSKLHSGQRLKYNSESPKTYKIPYYDSFKVADSAAVPEYYVLPAAWREVAQRLQYNGVELTPLSADSLISVSSYYLSKPEFAKMPYEGHFVLTHVDVEKREQQRQFFKGDFLIKTNQRNRRFIVNTLEPSAVDSYLRWNFFDEIYQQKEHFSAYVFEDTAAEILAKDPDLKRDFEQWKKDHPELAKNAYASLTFIYRHSPYYEKEHLRYPVARIE